MMRKTFAVAAVMAGLGAAGCGGEDAKPLTKEEFVKQANAICAKGGEEIQKKAEELSAGGEEPDMDAQIAFFEDEVLPNVEQQIDDIGELTPPEADVAEVEELLASAQGAVDKTKEDIEAVAASDEDPFEEANQKAKDYGLTDCAT